MKLIFLSLCELLTCFLIVKSSSDLAAQNHIVDPVFHSKEAISRKHQWNRYAGYQKRARLQMAAWIEKQKSGNGIEINLIPILDQICMEHAEDCQPHISTQKYIGHCFVCTAFFSAAGYKHNTSAEKKCKNAPHFAGDKNPVQIRKNQIEVGMRTDERRF
jgi:hypothetical protein